MDAAELRIVKELRVGRVSGSDASVADARSSIGYGLTAFAADLVKYRDTVDDLAAINYFLKEYGQPFGIVVTKEMVKTPEEEHLLFVPLAIFLLFF
jgi:hypothetical protein